jgi:iron complex transport system substrate-binding protein
MKLLASVLLAAAVIAGGGMRGSAGLVRSPVSAQEKAASTPQRIISLIPPVTETLFAIGAGAQVVAVSSFDNYPPEVEKLQRVGALLDPDVERILSLRPDLVIVYESQSDLRAQLARAHIPMYVYRHAGLSDITTTIREVGIRVGHQATAVQVAARIEQRIGVVRQRVAALPRPTTLVVFEREALTLRGIYASGGIGFIHDMLAAAGGQNIFSDV